jgi:hypothetical protein
MDDEPKEDRTARTFGDVDSLDNPSARLRALATLKDRTFNLSLGKLDLSAKGIDLSLPSLDISLQILDGQN